MGDRGVERREHVVLVPQFLKCTHGIACLAVLILHPSQQRRHVASLQALHDLAERLGAGGVNGRR